MEREKSKNNQHETEELEQSWGMTLFDSRHTIKQQYIDEIYI